METFLALSHLQSPPVPLLTTLSWDKIYPLCVQNVFQVYACLKIKKMLWFGQNAMNNQILRHTIPSEKSMPEHLGLERSTRAMLSCEQRCSAAKNSLAQTQQVKNLYLSRMLCNTSQSHTSYEKVSAIMLLWHEKAWKSMKKQRTLWRGHVIAASNT